MREALSSNNCRVVPLGEVPLLRIEAFRVAVIGAVQRGLRIVTFFGLPVSSQSLRLLAVLADDKEGKLFALSAVVSESYPSLSVDCPQAQGFEREICEEWGVIPRNHPWLKPIRAQSGLRTGVNGEFYAVEGSEVHEVAVGPVHAGIIEPGHFRFQCNGETVFHLEISLGYQHRGIEKRLIGMPAQKALHLMETIAGDTTIGHGLAYCQLVESFSGASVSLRSHAVRGILLELERLANHSGDLGALASDVAYLPTASYCGRIRGDFLNMTAAICGSRFGRGALRIGGVNFDINRSLVEVLSRQLEAAQKDLACAINLLWESSSVLDRFETTGKIPVALARELGMVGVVARACGVDCDVRRDFPFGIFRAAQITVSTFSSGDVFSRAFVRWLEAQRSVQFIQEQIGMLGVDSLVMEKKAFLPGSFVVSLVEGWRGEICHSAIIGEEERFARYKIVDSSFHNWIGLSMALRNQQISDFPLCNKSFNLSYCGHDL